MTGDADRRQAACQAPPSTARRVLTFLAVLVPIGYLALVVYTYAGPVVSGGLFLPWPTRVHPAPHPLPENYLPVHQGRVDLTTGLYVRWDEDLVIRGPVPLVLRRTYRSVDHQSRAFGIGATHDGEWFLVGDRGAFQWIDIVLADGERVHFDRTSEGQFYQDAMFEHRLGWTGDDWAVRLRDSSLLRFERCWAPKPRPCGLVEMRDADGHVTRLTRDDDGRLLRMAVGDEWIAFEYDSKDRVSRAFASTKEEVRYTYDAAGRLTNVLTPDHGQRAYGYTDQDEMNTVVDNGLAIENRFDAGGRCIEQTDRFAGRATPDVFHFAYRDTGGQIVEAQETRSDGTWRTFTIGPNGYTIGEAIGIGSLTLASVGFLRNAGSNIISELTVTCRDGSGRLQSHSQAVPPGQEVRVRDALVWNYCASSPRSGDRWMTDNNRFTLLPGAFFPAPFNSVGEHGPARWQ
jgi:YD repeat-containing protein